MRSWCAGTQGVLELREARDGTGHWFMHGRHSGLGRDRLKEGLPTAACEGLTQCHLTHVPHQQPEPARWASHPWPQSVSQPPRQPIPACLRSTASGGSVAAMSPLGHQGSRSRRSFDPCPAAGSRQQASSAKCVACMHAHLQRTALQHLQGQGQGRSSGQEGPRGPVDPGQEAPVNGQGGGGNITPTRGGSPGPDDSSIFSN